MENKAKRMFKDIGFELTLSDRNSVMYEEYTEHYHTTIIFDKKTKVMDFESIDTQSGDCTIMPVSPKLFSAIEQQRKELGW